MALPPRLKTRRPDLTANIAKDLVSRLYQEVLQESCVVFVGAGSTTERKRFTGETFFEAIKTKSQYPKDSPPPSFPQLMQYYCDHVDGGHHNRLIREAISRIEFFLAEREEHQAAVGFVNSLTKVPYLNRFVTTNWDPLLERSLEVLVPMVEDRDLAFWDDRKRQVLKIHGCITRPHSIVATETDYEACIDRNPLIFNKLRDLMATKTFLFTGYSMRDADFRQVWDGITRSQGHFAKLAYAVDPEATEETMAFWKDREVHLIPTYDLSFIDELRERLAKEGLIPSEQFLEFLGRERHRIVSIHIKLDQMSDGGFASAMYQVACCMDLRMSLCAPLLAAKEMNNLKMISGRLGNASIKCMRNAT